MGGCVEGYELQDDGSNACGDIDECTDNTDRCDDNAACTNNAGSHTCTCDPGFHGDGETCTAYAGECVNGDLIALTSRTKENHCGTCSSGYSMTGSNACEDINECEANQPELLYTNEHPRNEVATAMGCTNGNGVGDATCLAICEADQTCNFVWIYATSGRCCFKSSMTVNAAYPLRENNGGGHYYKVRHATDSCHNNAACANTAGSHTCTCNAGFHGTGESCTACTSCGAGFTETTACTASTDTVCTQNICTCDQGIEATGTACTAVAGHICASCLNGYYMAGTACAAYEGSCNNGAMIAQSSRTQENHCGTCGSGFGMTSTFSCETCSATDFQYSSENDNSPCADHVRCASGSGSNFDTLTNSQAVAASCQACLVGTHSDVNDYGPCDACTAFCTAGFTETTACTASTDRVCTQNVCTCDQGTAAVLAECTTDGANICSGC